MWTASPSPIMWRTQQQLALLGGLAPSVSRETSAVLKSVDSHTHQRQIADVLPSLHAQLQSELADLRKANRLRKLPDLSDASRVHVLQDGKPLISFCSNDYLGLATHPDVQAAALRAIAAAGLGASASRLVSGDLPDHRQLERELATFLGTEACLLFPSGYQANVGFITALAGPADLIVADRSVHASVIDGCRLSKAKLAFFPHLDLERASHYFRLHGSSRRRRFLLTESVFSMEGDLAPMVELSSLAHTHDAILCVDEAHALGSLGPDGRGLCAQQGVFPDILVGTLGKTFGASGAFVAGSQTLIDLLINRARPFIFSTAPPPAIAAAARTALRIIDSPHGEHLRQTLTENIQHLRNRLDLPPVDQPTPIVPIPLGSEAAALHAAHALVANGYFVQAIRPPTVRPGSSILRLTLSSQHRQSEIDGLATALRAIRATQPLPMGAPTIPTTPPNTTTPPTVLPTSATAIRTPGIFLCGTDTGVGKTTVARALLSLLTRRGRRPVPFKPVQTGASDPEDDATLLRLAANRNDLPPHVICPHSFSLPVTPAALPDSCTRPSAHTLASSAHLASTHGDFLLVESAGGALSPYNTGLTTLDLASLLRLPVLLVARDALGTINHTALTVAELRRRGLFTLGIVLVQTSPVTTPDQAANASLIEQATGIRPLGPIPYLATPKLSDLAAALQSAIRDSALDRYLAAPLASL